MNRPPRRRRLLPLVGLALGAALALGAFMAGPAPSIELTSARPAIGKATAVSARFEEPRRGLAGLRLELVQGERVWMLAERRHRPRPVWQPWAARTGSDRLLAEPGSATLEGLVAGTAVLRAVAERSPAWLRRPRPVVRELELAVRLEPPGLDPAAGLSYAAQGGAGVVVYGLGSTAVRDGVEAGDWWFPGRPLPGDEQGRRFALFGVPYDLGERTGVRLVAEDDAGNLSSIAFLDRLQIRRPQEARLELSEGFFEKVVPEILARTELADKGSLLASYLAINGELRRRNARSLVELAAHSADEFLWQRPFLPLPNAQVMSSFAVRRTYWLDGREVDRQVHLGYDLASVRRAAVPAANSGKVLLARYFGIYGNAVVVDHGCGLMSLYGHLSSFAVAEGEQVERGQLLGRTGETGLAGGDHLHFTMLVGGLAVDPLEWWDGSWIQNRVAARLGEGFPYLVEDPAGS